MSPTEATANPQDSSAPQQPDAATTAQPAATETPVEPLENDRLPLLKRPEKLEERLKEIPPEPGCYFKAVGNSEA